MEKVKVITIEANMQNGHSRIISAVVSLECSISEFCKEKRLSLLSIHSATESKPLCIFEAVKLVLNNQATIFSKPNTIILKSELSIEQNAA